MIVVLGNLFFSFFSLFRNENGMIVGCLCHWYCCIDGVLPLSSDFSIISLSC